MGCCPGCGGLVVTMDVDLGDIQTAVTKDGRRGFQVCRGFDGGGRQVSKLVGRPFRDIVLVSGGGNGTV
tara:strand:- start:388 stop:594 length:207 start_codon:yes stop_codon:yes gene_type:complete